MTPILQVRKVTKNFPPNVVALRGVDLEIMPGEIHCLLGANGAGKSTLLKVIAGAHRLDAGEILIAGKRSSFSNPVEAARAGISMIYQELDLIPQLTVTGFIIVFAILLNRWIDLRRSKGTTSLSA